MTVTQQRLPTGTWQSDPVHSSVTFRVKHLGVSTFRAGFAEIDAAYDGDSGTLTGSVPVASLDISQEDLRGHLLSAEFFDADRHPEVRFTATEVHRGDGDALVVPGELTISGVTKPVQARGRIGEPGDGMGGDRRIEIELSATIDRRDFGMDWQAELPGGKVAVANDVTLEVVLELTQPAE